MAGEMAAHFAVRRLPAAERLRVGRQAGVHAEIVQETVGVHAEEEGLVPQHGVAERAVQEWTSVRSNGSAFRGMTGATLSGGAGVRAVIEA